MMKVKKLRSLFTITVLFNLALALPAAAEPLLNGVATHSELGTEQFIAGLYTSTLSDSNSMILSSQEEKRIEVRVLADQLSTRRFKRMWIEGMAINSSPAELERHAKHMADFSNLLKIKMIAGDIFTVSRDSDIVEVAINGASLGEIDDTAFFDLLLRTWIGPVPLSSDFRQDLLVSGAIKPGPLSRFESTRPTETRIAVIKSALEAKQARESAEEKAPVAVAQAPVKAKIEAPIEKKAKPKVKAPTIAAPGTTATVAGAAAATAANADSPSSDSKPENKVAMAAPKVEETPEASPTSTPKPKKVALAPKQEELDLSIFEDEGDDEFTAESLLKEQLYYSKLAKYTGRFTRYPQRSWDRGQEGSVRLRVTIDRKGNVTRSEILEETKYRALNKEALKAVKRASPYPSMPEEVKGDDYSFNFTVTFKIVDR